MAGLTWLGELARRYFPSDSKVEPAPPLASYPTSEDAANALKYGFGYGDPRADAYVTGQSARVLGVRDLAGGYLPLSGGSFRTMDDLVSRLGTHSVNLSPAPFGISDTYARAALAANRIPIAGLGFDPGRMTYDTQMKNANIAGLYSPETDQIYFNQSSGRAPSTPVHESIHRGLEMLRQDPANAEAFKKMPQNEEEIVRYLMAKQAGDPELGTGSVADEQRKAALWWGEYGGERFHSGLAALTRAAEEAVKNRRPGGPR